MKLVKNNTLNLYYLSCHARSRTACLETFPAKHRSPCFRLKRYVIMLSAVVANYLKFPAWINGLGRLL